MMEVRISRILAPAYGYQPHHKRFKERHSYIYHYLLTFSLLFFFSFFCGFLSSPRVSVVAVCFVLVKYHLRCHHLCPCEGQTWDPQGQYQTARSSLAAGSASPVVASTALLACRVSGLSAR